MTSQAVYRSEPFRLSTRFQPSPDRITTEMRAYARLHFPLSHLCDLTALVMLEDSGEPTIDRLKLHHACDREAVHAGAKALIAAKEAEMKANQHSKEGKHVLIVGPAGSGKTTVIGKLLRDMRSEGVTAVCVNTNEIQIAGKYYGPSQRCIVAAPRRPEELDEYFLMRLASAIDLQKRLGRRSGGQTFTVGGIVNRLISTALHFDLFDQTKEGKLFLPYELIQLQMLSSFSPDVYLFIDAPAKRCEKRSFGQADYEVMRTFGARMACEPAFYHDQMSKAYPWIKRNQALQHTTEYRGIMLAIGNGMERYARDVLGRKLKLLYMLNAEPRECDGFLVEAKLLERYRAIESTDQVVTALLKFEVENEWKGADAYLAGVLRIAQTFVLPPPPQPRKTSTELEKEYLMARLEGTWDD